MNIKLLLVSLAIFVGSATGSYAQNSSAGSQAAAPAAEKSNPEPFTSDTPDILRETQLGVRHAGYSGLIWWIPFEFWKKSAAERGVSPEKTEETFGKLKDYTTVCVFAAKVSPLGAFDFFAAEQIQKNTYLRDSAGTEYTYIKEPSQDAKNLAAIIKPILSNAIGKLGDNVQILFFPGRTKDGAMIADPTHKGQFSIVLKNLIGEQDTVYLWRLPLTSVSTPKYCPVGKERVNLNWEYCPWHGVPLN